VILIKTKTGLASWSFALIIGAVLGGQNLDASPVFAQSMDVDTTAVDPKADENFIVVPDAAETAAAESSIEDGKALVELNCSGCHAVGTRDASPHEEAPPFRKLLQRYPIDALEEAFDSGLISSGHPDMPDFVARPDQVDAILDYFQSNEEK